MAPMRDDMDAHVSDQWRQETAQIQASVAEAEGSGLICHHH